MLIYGTGGHAKVIAGGLKDSGEKVVAYFDDDVTKLRSDHTFLYDNYLYREEPLLVAVGDNLTRRTLVDKISHSFGSLIHPTACVPEGVWVGVGSVVLQRTILQYGAYVGRHVIINTGASVDHDCVIEDFVHLAPGVILCGGVSIGENTLIGAGTIVTPNVSIGKNCLVAAGSIISTSLPDNTIVRKCSGRASLN